jgi:hypothetical protein
VIDKYDHRDRLNEKLQRKALELRPQSTYRLRYIRMKFVSQVMCNRLGLSHPVLIDDVEGVISGVEGHDLKNATERASRWQSTLPTLSAEAM